MRDPEQPVDRREHELDRGPLGGAGGGVRVPAGELGDEERPANEPDGLDQAGRDGKGERDGGGDAAGGDHHGRRGADRDERERDDGERPPADDQGRPASLEPFEDLTGLAAQDVGVVERPGEIRERDVERDGQRDERDPDDEIGGHALAQLRRGPRRWRGSGANSRSRWPSSRTSRSSSRTSASRRSVVVAASSRAWRRGSSIWTMPDSR